MIEAAQKLAPAIGVVQACEAVALARATYYRHRERQDRGPAASQDHPPRPRSSARKLTEQERLRVREILHCDRFVDMAPAEIVATLLDEGDYACSTRTMYRILEQAGENRERRDQLVHPAYHKPELLATGPNQIWSWDITKLKGPATWTYFYLYVILDIFSRYVVGWLIAGQESASLAKQLISETCQKQQIDPDQLTIHSDRGTSMRSKLVAQLLADLGVTKSHSRPSVSNDNPFSESQFKTMKYRPEFPRRFEGFDHAKSFCQGFFQWYNRSHRHSGIAMLTPEQLHYGEAEAILEHRQRVLDAAYRAHPERFVGGPPRVDEVPKEVWINPPTKPEAEK